jgi:hypothetical protein
MELVNHTPIPADLRAAYLVNTPNRRGVLTAKATFRFDGGRVELERERPYPVLDHLEEHAGSHLPPDVTMSAREPFEVMLVGAAEAPGGLPVAHRRVTMTLGEVTRAIEVFGDRAWAGETIGDPVPFTSMPLTWERAYGGSVDVEIDDGAVVTLGEPMNPLGRGFDPTEQVEALAHELRPPQGFPRFARPLLLPNLEDPAARIVSPSDTPRPVCWAPVPDRCGVKIAHVIDRAGGHAPAIGVRVPELEAAAVRHAHPAWWISRPRRGARLRLAGLFADGDKELELPSLRVFGDYAVGARRGTRELVPQALVVLPSERRLCITYRASFLVRYEPGEERSFRLRTEEGWYGEGHG